MKSNHIQPVEGPWSVLRHQSTSGRPPASPCAAGGRLTVLPASAFPACALRSRQRELLKNEPDPGAALLNSQQWPQCPASAPPSFCHLPRSPCPAASAFSFLERVCLPASVPWTHGFMLTAMVMPTLMRR